MIPAFGKSLSKKTKQSVKYPNIPSTTRPVPHREGISVPDAMEPFSLDSDGEKNEDCSLWPMSNAPDIDAQFSYELQL